VRQEVRFYPNLVHIITIRELLSSPGVSLPYNTTWASHAPHPASAYLSLHRLFCVSLVINKLAQVHVIIHFCLHSPLSSALCDYRMSSQVSTATNPRWECTVYSQMPLRRSTSLLSEVSIPGKTPTAVLTYIGGTAGCVVASRLSDADSGLSILVVEEGSDNFQNPKIIYPGLYRLHLAPGSPTSVIWTGQEEEQLMSRAIPIATGAVLGGSSSINVATYARGQLSDFDSWNAKGWTGEEVLPFLKRVSPPNPLISGWDLTMSNAL
jgi:hypothetical protein